MNSGRAKGAMWLVLAFSCGLVLPRVGKFKNVLTGSPTRDGPGYSAPVQQELISQLGEPVEIFDPASRYVYKTEPELSGMGKAGLHSYRYYSHYREVADYLLSPEVKREARQVHDEFWDVAAGDADEFARAMQSRREFLEESLGVRKLPPGGEEKSRVLVSRSGSTVLEKVELESRIRSITVPLYVGSPSNGDIKGVVIAIHGHSGAPEKVLGMEAMDYTRAFGAELVKEGYVVMAPYVLNISRLNTNIHALGMLYSGNTKYSIDLQKLLSLVDHIKKDDALSSLPLAVYGVSYGGRLALLLSCIDPRIDVTITSGSMKLNRGMLERHFALDSEVYWANEVIYNRPYHVYFSFADLAKLVYPRPLVMVLGAYDLGESPTSVIEAWKAIGGVYRMHDRSDDFRLIWFKGYHETAPRLTIPVLNGYVERWTPRPASRTS